MLKMPLPKILLISFVLFCHVLSMLMPASAAMNMYALDIKNQDITPVCSGNGKVRWIKLSDFYETGKITFLEVEPQNSSTEEGHNTNKACPICSIYNQLDNLSIGLITHTFIIEKNTSEVPISFIAHFTKRSILTPSSRDPPFLIYI